MSDHDPLAPLPTKTLFHYLRVRRQGDLIPAAHEACTVDERLPEKILTTNQRRLLYDGPDGFEYQTAWEASAEILIRLVAAAYLRAKWARLQARDERTFAAATCNIPPARLDFLPTAQHLTEAHAEYDRVAAAFDLYRELLELADHWDRFQVEHQAALEAIGEPFCHKDALEILGSLRESAVGNESDLRRLKDVFDCVVEGVREIEEGWQGVNRDAETLLAADPAFIQQATDARLVDLLVPLDAASSPQDVEARRQLLRSLRESLMQYNGTQRAADGELQRAA